MFNAEIAFPFAIIIGEVAYYFLTGTGNRGLIAGGKKAKPVVIEIYFQVFHGRAFYADIDSFFIGGVGVFGQSLVIMGTVILVVMAVYDAGGGFGKSAVT